MTLELEKLITEIWAGLSDPAVFSGYRINEILRKREKQD